MPNAPTIAGRSRAALWLLLILLTLSILLFPVHLSFEYHPIQSVHVFDSLATFAAVYFAWLAVFLGLLFTGSRDGLGDWEKAALAGTFVLVFLGFWAVVTPYTREEGTYFLGHASYLKHYSIPLGHPNLNYMDFPGLALYVNALSQITGIDDLDTRMLVLLWSAALTGFLLYCLYRPLTRHGSAIFLVAVPLAVQSSMMLSVGFFLRPENALGLLHFITLAILLFPRQDAPMFLAAPRGRALVLILFTALAVTHLVTALAFVVLLVCVSVARGSGGRPTLTLGLAAAVILGSWVVYYAVATFDNVADYLPRLRDHVQEGDLFYYVNTLRSANVSEQVPLWARITRASWWLVIYALGGLLAVVTLLRARRLGAVRVDYAAGLIAVALLTGVTTVVSGTGSQFYRYLEYGSFFAVPVVLGFIGRPHLHRFGVAAALLLFVSLSLPSFFAHNGRIGSSAYYPPDIAVGRFLESRYGPEQERLTIFTSLRDRLLYTYYLPDSTYKTEPFEEPKYGEHDSYWRALHWLSTGFQNPVEGEGGFRIFVLSDGFVIPYVHTAGLRADDPRWDGFKGRLEENDRFLDVGPLQLYAP